MRVAVLFHRFGPYHCARLEAASRCLDTIGIEITAETSEYDWAPIAASGNYERVTLFPVGDAPNIPGNEILRRMDDALRNCRPDVVAIPGWSARGALAALQWCIGNGIPAVLMSESTAHDEPRHSWKEFIKRRLVKLYSTALVGGQRHIDYLLALGMSRDRVFTGYDVVDNDYFARSAKEISSQKSEIGKKHDLPKNYFLASARFIKKKNLSGLLRAYAKYRNSAGESAWSLVLLGNGPLRPDLCRLISDLGLNDFVALPGFKQYDELPVFYALANAFVHASTTEQWGLVVNEALASGLPVIVSDRCGCVPELVHDGVNGFTFNPHDEGQLASRLLAIASLPGTERERFANASREIASAHGVDQFGKGLECAARSAMASPKQKGRWPDRFIMDRLLSR